MKISPIQGYKANFTSNNRAKRRATAVVLLMLVSHPFAQKASADTSPDDFRVVKYSDLYYAIVNDGGKYDLKAHYDSGRNGKGAYYQYGNNAYTKKDGKKISNPEKLYGFVQIEEKTQTQPVTPQPYYPPVYTDPTPTQPVTPQPYYPPVYTDPTPTQPAAPSDYYPPIFINPTPIQTPTPTPRCEPQPAPKPTPTPEIKLDPRIPKGSDFYYAYLRYGDKYKIKPHYDAGSDGIGAYYQYGRWAFDEKGREIKHPENLFGFDTKIK